MSSPPQSPTHRIRPGSRDTGFPEPFCGQRNTTLPHPDANLSPDAVISQDDITINKVLSRTRRSFLLKHKRTISHGFITREMEAMYSDPVVEADESATALHLDLDHHDETGKTSASSMSMSMSGRPSHDGRDSLASNGGDLSPTSSGTPRRRRSGLRKFFRF